jgi:hypothetical protein
MQRTQPNVALGFFKDIGTILGAPRGVFVVGKYAACVGNEIVFVLFAQIVHKFG